ncbi:MAG: ParA family protein [Sphaerochaetaceae bacterium]|nr:ParA family protein [Sphaerochaetaceae bacterium]
MSKTVAFHLQKGGVGKTTISGTLACQSALSGKKTLIIDCDPQGNVSSWFLENTPKFELSDVLQGRCFVDDAIVKVPCVDNLYILPTFGVGGTLKIYSETKLAEEPYVLLDLVGDVSQKYERIVLDLSPGLGRLERSALIASDEVISPMTSEVFSLDGLQIFIHELSKLRKNMRASVRHDKIIINSFDTRIRQHKDIYAAAMESGKYKVYQIPVDPIFRKAQEANKCPQLFKVRGRGMKTATLEAFSKLNKDVWKK